MKFRTEIEAVVMPQISHADCVVMLGSCFTDSIGERLEHDGFDVMHNPLGTLYNAASIERAIMLALGIQQLNVSELVTTDDGRWHCLDFTTRYVSDSAQSVLDSINGDLSALGAKLQTANMLVMTLGTAYVYRRGDTAAIVGNCHKLPAAFFERSRMSVEECVAHLDIILACLPSNIEHVVFTVSPIRHLADGLHGNELSKATLLMAIDSLDDPRVSYFPSYEMMIDDLRDYRFYAADMKHPSDIAVDYIYERLAQACFTPATAALGADCRKRWLRSQHREMKNEK